ncbi:hypothetical protein Zmor_025677 [Zophobas morio]|uniref:Cytochrome P450 n=1 Tax=Zophobas morio TaxID=2755281 RepID=A0AA38HSD1_9CUCU|nr:hypothetical protein Zmor_025677 [Zophobas morio]
MVVFRCSFSNFLALIATLTVVVIAYFKWSFQYWKRRNLPHLKPTIPWGTSTNPFNPDVYVGLQLKRQYDEMKTRGWKHGGLFSIISPAYLVTDLDYLKNIMAKDFQYFVDRGFYYNEKDDPLSAHLFAIGGQKWRNLRTKFTPTFTSGKMKMMFQTLIDCLPNLREKMETGCDSQAPIDIKEILGCFTTDVIGTCAFGLDCNTIKEENSPFREYGRKAMLMSPMLMLGIIFGILFPNAARRLGVIAVPSDVSAFFMKVVKETVQYRETNKITRNDFMQIVIDLKNQGDDVLTIEELAAQCFVFFLAGFETSSTVMTFTLYELARNPHLQEKVRQEINTVLDKHDGKITYEAIQEMKYMDQVINEALRMYPPLSFLTKKCVKNYKIPDEDVIIEEGVNVVIPVLAIHYDEEYYPKPEKFDPQRFSEENKKSRHPYAHIPFGEGPRVCIGLRFGLMQTKVGLTTLLKDYRFVVNKKTPEPLKMKVNSLVTAVDGEIWLNAEKI